MISASIEELNEHMQTHILHMSCSNPVAIDKLEALEAISSVQQKGDKLILHCSHDNFSATEDKTSKQPSAQQTSQQLIALAAAENWGLYEIYPEKRTLEDIFMSLTCVEPSLAHNEKQEQAID